MANQPTAEDFLGGSRVKSAQFGKRQKGMSPVPGTVERGPIVEEPETMQQRRYAPNKPNDGELLYWDDEKTQPRWQLVVKIQTDERLDDDDDGIRAIYVSGQMKTAIQDALKAAKVKKLEVGGILAVKFVEQIINKNDFRQNMFAAQYIPPSKQDDFFGGAPASASTPDAAGNVANHPAGTTSMLDRLKDQAASRQPAGPSSPVWQDEPPF